MSLPVEVKTSFGKKSSRINLADSNIFQFIYSIKYRWIYSLFKSSIQINKNVKLYTYTKLGTRPFPWPFLLGSSKAAAALRIQLSRFFSLEAVWALGCRLVLRQLLGRKNGLTESSMPAVSFLAATKTGRVKGLFPLLYVTIKTVCSSPSDKTKLDPVWVSISLRKFRKGC